MLLDALNLKVEFFEVKVCRRIAKDLEGFRRMSKDFEEFRRIAKECEGFRMVLKDFEALGLQVWVSRRLWDSKLWSSDGFGYQNWCPREASALKF